MQYATNPEKNVYLTNKLQEKKKLQTNCFCINMGIHNSLKLLFELKNFHFDFIYKIFAIKNEYFIFVPFSFPSTYRIQTVFFPFRAVFVFCLCLLAFFFFAMNEQITQN